MKNNRITRLAAVLLAACTFSAMPCAAESEWGEELTRVPNDTFIQAMDSQTERHYTTEWYYTGDAPVQNGVPQEKNFTLYKVNPPAVEFSALHSTEEEFAAAIEACFPGAVSGSDSRSAEAQYVYYIQSTSFRTTAAIHDMHYDIDSMDPLVDAFYDYIAGTETLDGALYDTAAVRLDLQEFVYYRKIGVMNYAFYHPRWWCFSGWYTPDDPDTPDFSVIDAYLAEHEPDWHTVLESDGTALGIYPNESIAADVTFADYTAVLAGITAATGYTVPMPRTAMGGFSVAENGEKVYMEKKQILFGDVDGSGKVELDDAMAALRAASDLRVGLTPELTPEQIGLADVDGDNACTVKDAQYILRYYSDTRLGIACDWQSLTGNQNAPA